MRWKKLLTAALVAALFHLPAIGEVRLMAVSDIHYLDSALHDDSDCFLRVLKAGDGKLTQAGDALLTALKRQVEKEKPDALLVTGDLSFNGERASHLRLAQCFAEIEAAGVPVWVLPGNHDINVPVPRSYAAEGWTAVPGVTPEAFSEIYGAFLGVPTEGAGLSYAAEVGKGLRVAMTDVAFYMDTAQVFGLFLAGHHAWLEEALRTARDDGAEVITASHHSLIAHTEYMKDSFLMLGSESMEALDREYGVRLHLSGHLHAQHIARTPGLADAATGAFCTYPHRFALLTLEDDGALTYEARALDDDCLPEGFQAMSREWYMEISREKTRSALAAYDLTEEEREAMADFAARFSLAYFSGTLRDDDPAWREDPALKYWSRWRDGIYLQIMQQLMNESGGNQLRLALK